MDRSMDLKVVSARDLNNVNLLMKMDVYAVVKLVTTDSDGKLKPISGQKFKTPIDKEGGSNPIWNFSVKFSVDEAAARANRLTLVFKLRCQRNLGDKDIGEVYVSVKELLDSAGDGKGDLMQHLSYQVRKPSGNPQGVLNLAFKFGDNLSSGPVKPEPVQCYDAGSTYPPPEPSSVAVTHGGAYPPPPPSQTETYPPPSKLYPVLPPEPSAPEIVYCPYPPPPTVYSTYSPVTSYNSYAPAPLHSAYASPPSQPTYGIEFNHQPPPSQPPYGIGYNHQPFPSQPAYGIGYNHQPPTSQPPYAYNQQPPPQTAAYGYPPPPNYGYPPPGTQNRKANMGMGLGAGLAGGMLGGLLVGGMVSEAADGGFGEGFDF